MKDFRIDHDAELTTITAISQRGSDFFRSINYPQTAMLGSHEAQAMFAVLSDNGFSWVSSRIGREEWK